ncbi:hypothetical protein T4A_1094 [Trichinella pseudospiralis]|uniref:Uncharacterized protein n=1 Tax=Trichinella pseudospiralis TaxID=6337 RepID=A0A0V1DR50_TRIPS|nr:hypothetical protein T4A_1094 [Trichinella pseudospiralis]
MEDYDTSVCQGMSVFVDDYFEIFLRVNARILECETTMELLC